jgi:CubicO group peptidase (beta-lactamase class C family)
MSCLKFNYLKIFSINIFLIFIFSLFLIQSTKAQSLYFQPLIGNQWETVNTESLGWCADSVQKVIDYVGSNNSKAFIVLVNGKIAIEEYYGTFTQDSLWYWASAGKSLTSFMVGMAQQEGVLNINDISAQYLGNGWTNCSAPQEQNIKILNQLTMTSGLDDGSGDADCTIDTCLNYLADAGTRWAYHNAPYTLLDEVISNASGISMNSFLNSRIKSRTGITGFYLPIDFNNVMFSTARSMARYGLLISNNGVWNDDSLMTDQQYFNNMINTSQNLNKSYGYLWWLNGKESFMLPGLQNVFPGYLLPDAPADLFAGIGKNGQYVFVIPSLNMVVIRMGNLPNDGALVPTIFANEIWKKMANINCEITSVNNVDKEELIIYPNPSSDFITIKINSKNYTGKYELINLTGKIILKNNYTNKIDLSEIEPGIYYLKTAFGSKKILIINE